MSYDDERVTVPVHIASSDVHLAAAAPPPAARKRRGLSVRSFTLTTSDPVQEILPQNLNRCEAWISPATNPITIGSSKADALGGGGGVATVPAAGNVPWPVNTTDGVWATAAVLPTTVSVLAIIEE